jgi:hypothetical protein
VFPPIGFLLEYNVWWETAKFSARILRALLYRRFCLTGVERESLLADHPPRRPAFAVRREWTRPAYGRKLLQDSIKLKKKLAA